MSDVTHVLDLLPAFALGSLEDAESRQVAEHLAACEACRAELAALETLSGRLALAAAEATPSEDVRQRLMERARRQHEALRASPSTAPRPWASRPVWAIASLILILALAASNALLWQRLMALEARRGPLDMRAIALHNTGLAPEASGFVLISADGENGTVVVDQLPQLAEDLAYQLWLMRAGQSTSGALFTVDETGYRGARIVAPDSLLTYASVQITIEPVDGSLAPSGELVLDAALNNP